jgi:arsenite methyltransferase
MRPHTITPANSSIASQEASTPMVPVRTENRDQSESLFEHVAWLYAFFREHLFRDDTDRMITALWPSGQPTSGTELIEFGCGPGFYSRRLAQPFPQISVTGVDRSENQLRWARERASAIRLSNCLFECVNVLQLPCADARFDALIASRLFTVLPEPNRAIAEMYRVLKPGGRCFVAEPRYAFWASLPLFAMWLLAGVMHSRNGYREPQKATVFSASAFKNLFMAQPWKQIKTWQDGRYQYALCEKG